MRWAVNNISYEHPSTPVLMVHPLCDALLECILIIMNCPTGNLFKALEYAAKGHSYYPRR